MLASISVSVHFTVSPNTYMTIYIYVCVYGAVYGAILHVIAKVRAVVIFDSRKVFNPAVK